MNRRIAWTLIVLIALAGSPAAQKPSFRTDVSLVVVDVVVRDKSGAVVRGLTANDFEIREDKKPQQITSFDVEEITTTAPATPVPQVLAVGAQGTVGSDKNRPTAAVPTAEPVRREDLSGRRLIVLLFVYSFLLFIVQYVNT